MKNLNLEKNLLFSFIYGDTPSENLLFKDSKTTCEVSGKTSTFTTVYKLPDGLEITRVVKTYKGYDALDWVLFFHNTSNYDSKVISKLNDCDIHLEVGEDETSSSLLNPRLKHAKICNPTGSNWTRNEFFGVDSYIPEGAHKIYAPDGGRSSFGIAPYFDVTRNGSGYLCAIGWSGQWHSDFVRKGDTIHMVSGVEDASFKLLPGEKIRTTSTVILAYSGGQNAGHNLYRRLVKEHFCIIGKACRPDQGALCISTWGSVHSDVMIDQLKRIKKADLGAEYYWIDAAWFGAEKYAYGDHWYWQTGDYVVNQQSHPDGLLDVAAAVRDCGMKFLLWLEAERANDAHPIPKAHPDWFFKPTLPTPSWYPKRTVGEGPDPIIWLLNLGDEEALSYITELVCGYIENLQLSCYRTDFAFDPVNDYWRGNDQPDRRGINEIKHIMGLYRFYDTILERFPTLFIDNCASGGRRLDIEMMSRSIPLWRSDYMCEKYADVETTQTHTSGFSWWMPYSGTGTNQGVFDDYSMRSSYSPTLVINFIQGDIDNFPADEKELEKLRNYIKEYKNLRPYYSCDFYPLMNKPSLDDSNWEAQQFDRPEEDDGMIIAFRRPASPIEMVRFMLGGIKPDKIYTFINQDTDEKRVHTSNELTDKGFVISLLEPRSTSLWLYSCS